MLFIISFKAAYTFDAGANACVYLLENEVSTFVSYLNAFFPNVPASNEYIRGIPVQLNQPIESVKTRKFILVRFRRCLLI